MNKPAGLAAVLIAALQQQEDPGVAWVEHYTPEEAARYAPELANLEAELDRGFPGWREQQPFHELKPTKIAWIKHRLKRRHLIVNGNGAYGVRIDWRHVERDAHNQIVRGKPIASAVRPGRMRSPHFAPVVSVADVAVATGASTQQVREALTSLPHHERDAYGWTRTWLQERRASEGAGRAPQAAKPPPTSPTLGGAS